MDFVLWTFAGLLVVAGLAGVILPFLPGAPLLFAGLLVAAWIEGFKYVGGGTLIVLGLLGILTYAADFLAGSFGARRFGASRYGVIGALLGGIAGLFAGLPGILIGPFAGAVAGELLARRDPARAGRAGVGATVGLVLGAAAKVALSLTMIAIFVFVRFF